MSFGKIATWSTVTVDPVAEEKKVVFRPSTASDTVRIGDLVCYNADLAADWQERTSNPITGTFGASGNETTYAEGAQTYNARFLVVEKPASGNLYNWAVVKALGPLAGADGDLIEVYVPKNGAVVPVMCDKSVIANSTILAVNMGQYEATSPLYGGSSDASRVIGIALETVDRSSTDGLVWMVMSTSGIHGITGGVGGVSANQLLISSGETSGTLLGEFVSIKSTQTGGDASAMRVRMEAAGAGMNIGLGAIRAEGVVNANIGHTASYDVDACAVSAHCILKTGCTPAASTVLTGLYAKLENQDGTPANLANASISALTCVLQNDDAPSLSTQMRFVNQGSDAPDAWFTADTAAAIASYVSTGDAPALATGDLMIPIKVAGSDYYIVALADSGV